MSTLFPTSLVGSYAQPDWLIDRAKLAGRFPPRVRALELWRVAPEWLEEAQDDATILAIRDQERAGLDIITDGEARRESYSNRFATALEGVDIENPGTALDRSGHPNPVPRVVGKVRRKHPVQLRDLAFLLANTDRPVKMTVPGPFTMSQQAQNDAYETEEELALDYAAAVNEEIHDLFAAGADVVQIDEPYMQARPEKARQYGVAALTRALDGVAGNHRGPHLLRLRGDHPRAAVGLLVPPRARRGAGGSRCRSRPRSRTWTRPSSPACPGRRSSSACSTSARTRSSRRRPSPTASSGRLPNVPADRIIAAPDCGMKYLPRDVAFGKMSAMVAGAGTWPGRGSAPDDAALHRRVRPVSSRPMKPTTRSSSASPGVRTSEPLASTV